jgi:hypothetical protein
VYIDWTPFINTQQGLWQRTDAHKVSIFCPPPLKSVYFLSMHPLRGLHSLLILREPYTTLSYAIVTSFCNVIYVICNVICNDIHTSF